MPSPPESITAGPATAAETRIVVGADTQVDGADAYFARVSGTEATFAVPKARVTAILDAL